MHNILSIDVEDYFHPTEVQAYVRPGDWERLPERVGSSTRQLLDVMARYDVRGTFFILGWVAKRNPGLIAEIARAGHEIGCHSFAHRLVYELSPNEFRTDTRKAVAAIEDACGVSPRVYRAPSYSITKESLWALEILVECGFTHDSSIYPIRHDRYGIPGFHRDAQVLPTSCGPILEVPIATVRLSSNFIAPVGGGGNLRMLPYRYTAAGIRRINDEEKRPACIYLHPWEVDPEQPRLARGLVARLRTYSGIYGMLSKLERLLGDFRFTSIGTFYSSTRTGTV
jgi:polysaccharide deacetylase family protein (PEP-CTERM system associated)